MGLGLEKDRDRMEQETERISIGTLFEDLMCVQAELVQRHTPGRGGKETLNT